MVHGDKPRKNVLVIDDNPAMRGLLEIALHGLGYGVLTAQTGQEGLEIAGEQAVDAILLDLAMPDKSGLDVLEELKREERTGDIPVLLISGFANLVPPPQAQKASAVIQKPFRFSDLQAQLRRLLS